MTQKPFSQACENNKDPILTELKRLFANVERVLEVGSGTGQHAAYFAPKLRHLFWQPTDVAQNLEGIELWVAEANAKNLGVSQVLNMERPNWRNFRFDALYSANTAHIMPWPLVQTMIAGAGAELPSGGLFVLYGPFNYNGKYTSASNERFDAHLRSVAPHQGIRHFEKIEECAQDSGLRLQEDIAMPANNRLLVWQKK